ncbi:hypothetical protein QJQ45_007539 [Haematococcus lacustris]|nr:hypothetical protein QJQ45_007539 [Haematococcus lacustris]
MQRSRQRKRNRNASDIEVDREVEAQPEPSQGQKNKKAAAAAASSRVQQLDLMVADLTAQLQRYAASLAAGEAAAAGTVRCAAQQQQLMMVVAAAEQGVTRAAAQAAADQAAGAQAAVEQAVTAAAAEWQCGAVKAAGEADAVWTQRLAAVQEELQAVQGQRQRLQEQVQQLQEGLEQLLQQAEQQQREAERVQAEQQAAIAELRQAVATGLEDVEQSFLGDAKRYPDSISPSIDTPGHSLMAVCSTEQRGTVPRRTSNVGRTVLFVLIAATSSSAVRDIAASSAAVEEGQATGRIYGADIFRPTQTELAALQTRTAHSSAQALSDTAANTIGISSPQQQQQPQQWQQAQLEAQAPVEQLGKAKPVRQGQEAQEQGRDHRLLGQGQGLGQWQQRSLLQSPSPKPSSPTRSGPSQISLNDLLSGCNDCGSVSLNIDLGGLGLGKIQANIPIPKVPPQPKPAKPLPQHPALPNPPGITINDLFAGMPQGASGSGQKDISDEGQGDKEVIGQRRQVTEAALRGLVEAARFDLSQPQVDAVVAEAPPPPAQDQPPAQPPPGPVPRPQAPPGGRWLDRDTNGCLNFQRIGESMQRPLELCS